MGEQHERINHHHHDREQVGIALLTISSSRTLETDPAGDTAEALFTEAGHTVAARDLTRDHIHDIQESITAYLRHSDIELILTMGGTGITPDDVTPEAIQPMLDRELPGFGERFRARSVADIGERAIASRAFAGIAGNTLIFCVPGSKPAVSMAIEELILPVGGHLVALAHRSNH